MAQTYESGYSSTLAAKLNPTDNTMSVATAPTVTAGRLFLKNKSQKEWIKFTGVSGSTLTGLVRGLSKTADPATSGTGLSRVAGTVVKLVAMHDQLPDKQGDNTWSGTNTFTEEMSFTNVSDLNVNGTSNPYPVVADPTARDALYTAPVTGDGVYVESLNAVQIYNTGTSQRETQDVGTPAANASTTVKGVVEEATTAEIGAGTGAGDTGARLFINPTSTVKTSTGASDENKLPILDSTGKLADGFIPDPLYFGDGSDGDVTISGSVTLTRDMFYDNLTLNTGNTLIPNGFRVFVKGSLTGDGAITLTGGTGSKGANGSPTAAGGAGATSLNLGTLQAVRGGTAGGTGVIYNGSTTVVTTPVAAATTMFGYTTNGSIVRGPFYNKLVTTKDFVGYLGSLASLYFYPYKVGGQVTGGAGGSYNTGSVGEIGGGGGGGGSGGLIRLAVNTMNFTGTITANGGIGGAGGDAAGGVGRGGNGGHGGHGGVIYVIYSTLTSLGTTSVLGGAGGAAGTGANGNGTAGTSGSNGAVIQIDVNA